MVTITYATVDGHTFSDAMDSVDSFRRYRGDADTIVSVSDPYPVPAVLNVNATMLQGRARAARYRAIRFGY